jgi:hypothetical protein
MRDQSVTITTNVAISAKLFMAILKHLMITLKKGDGPYGQGNVPGKAVHRLCPNSLGCLLESGSPVSIGLIFPIPARPGLSGVRSTAGGLLECSPNAFPSVEAASEVSFPHPEGLSVFGFAASAFPGVNTTAAIAASTAIVVMYLMFIFKRIRLR